MSTAAGDGSIPLTSDPAGEDRLEDTLALCLSGGGYRAMLFHLGTLWYLHDAGYLGRLDRVSSVSGGSITAAVLATRWNALPPAPAPGQTTFRDAVAVPLLELADTTIDADSVIGGILLPGTINERIDRHYRELLFGDATLQSFPDRPRFVINATNVQTGSLFRFSKPYLADWRIGRVLAPTTTVAEAVAASSAFPPVLSPATLELDHRAWTELNTAECGNEPFTTKLFLTDGGVYDNLGIETAWKRCARVLVSDAGAKYQPDDEPDRDWLRHSLRINDTIDNQVRSLRKRQLLHAFTAKDAAGRKLDPHSGAYWGMWSAPSHYPAASALPIDDERALQLAHVPTRLRALPEALRNRVVNFGYGMAERAIRSHFDANALAAERFPLADGV